jgi:phosphopantetheinyl transferase
MIAWRHDFSCGRDEADVVARVLTEDELEPTARDLAEAPPREALRTAFLRRRAATRRAVAARLGALARDVEIGHAASGAPLVLAPRCALKISVAGREDFCAVAMSSNSVGVDIEPLRPGAEPPWNVLHPRERAALEALAGAARDEALLRLWTAKEAYLKALGLGLAREPTRVAVDLDFRISDEESTAKVLACAWRRLALGKSEFIAACVVLG